MAALQHHLLLVGRSDQAEQRGGGGGRDEALDGLHKLAGTARLFGHERLGELAALLEDRLSRAALANDELRAAVGELRAAA